MVDKKRITAYVPVATYNAMMGEIYTSGSDTSYSYYGAISNFVTEAIDDATSSDSSGIINFYNAIQLDKELEEQHEYISGLMKKWLPGYIVIDEVKG